MQLFFELLTFFDNLLWSYLALGTIFSLGLYFTISSKFYQVRVLKNVVTHFRSLIKEADKSKVGVHPLKLYFASLGGMVGIGNLVAVMSTVAVGGPGSLVWLWFASFIGMIVKYCEIYLSISFRKANDNHGYDGGPMYYLKEAFGNKWVPMVFCVLICIYGAEVSQFLVITDTFVQLFELERVLVIGLLLTMVVLSAVGGVKRLANICSMLLPPFLLVYICIGLYVIALHYTMLPSLFMDIIKSAFVGHAPVGGFVGSTILLAAHFGVSRAVYSGDIGIGYDAIVLSESQTQFPEKQARMSIFALFVDTIICTMSILIVLLTGVWHQADLPLSQYIVTALDGIVPYHKVFISALFFIAGITTIIGYMVIGLKAANFLYPRYGKNLYIAYAVAAFIFFSFHEQDMVMLIMSVSGGTLMVINLLGIFRLRRHIRFL